DQLTGLANRTAFDAEFARLADIAARDEQPLTIALIDMDGFKEINYRHGHALGDVVLQRLAIQLSSAFRGGDVLARWGGQEIAIAMYGMRRSDGVARVATVLEAFRAESFETSIGPLHLTFTAGIAESPWDGTDLVRLIRAAGAAVREAKLTGGDRVLPAGWKAQDDPSATDVLLVEDDEVLVGLLMHALHTRGLRSRHVADGQTALDLLTGPDRLRARVVLLDVDLPGINGLDVLGQLSRRRAVERSRIIMLTARSGESEVLTALRLGAFDHVAKPFSLPVLMQRVRRALDG
ncbi:MAG: diguanylate cyclase domain-containing protein, partial [Nocardioidaceae bacterium]